MEGTGDLDSASIHDQAQFAVNAPTGPDERGRV